MFRFTRFIINMANHYRVGGNPASLDPQNLTKKLRSLQASVGAIKEDMR